MGSLVRLLYLLCALLAANPCLARTPAPTPPPTPDDASLSGADTDRERTLHGRIDARAFDLIAKWLRAHPHHELTLHLDSRGGKVIFGAKLYDAISAHGTVATDVDAGQSCQSACTFLWLAGTTRAVEDGGFLGFHSAFCQTECDLRGIGLINQTLLDILARTEPNLAVLISRTGAMISGNHLMALVRRQGGQWQVKSWMPP